MTYMTAIIIYLMSPAVQMHASNSIHIVLRYEKYVLILVIWETTDNNKQECELLECSRHFWPWTYKLNFVSSSL